MFDHWEAVTSGASFTIDHRDRRQGRYACRASAETAPVSTGSSTQPPTPRRRWRATTPCAPLTKARRPPTPGRGPTLTRATPSRSRRPSGRSRRTRNGTLELVLRHDRRPGAEPDRHHHSDRQPQREQHRRPSASTVANVAPVVTAAAIRPRARDVEVVHPWFVHRSGYRRPWAVTVNWGDGSTDTTFTEASPGTIRRSRTPMPTTGVHGYGDCCRGGHGADSVGQQDLQGDGGERGAGGDGSG